MVSTECLPPNKLLVADTWGGGLTGTVKNNKIHVHTNPGAACGACSGGWGLGFHLDLAGGAAACHLPAPAGCGGSSWGPPTLSLLLARELLPNWWFLWRPTPHLAPSAVSSYWPPARSSRYIKAWAYPVVAQGGGQTRRERLPGPGEAHPSTAASSKPLLPRGSSGPTGRIPAAAGAPY